MASLVLVLSLAFTTILMSVMLLGLAALLAANARSDWRATWHGHEILVRNMIFSEELYIDGELADHNQAGMRFRTTLTGHVEEGERKVPVHVNIGQSKYYTGVHLEVYCDGQSVGLERGAIAAFADSAREGPSVPQPSDPRWNAVARLLDAIRASSPDADVQGAEDRLRTLLLASERLARDHDAHQVLDDGDGDGAMALMALRQAHEERIRALVRAIQVLHIATVQGAARAKDGPEQQLLATLSVESEVADPDAARRAARDRARRRELERSSPT